MGNMQLALTDNQWYNFICGMQAGLKLKNLTIPNYDTNIVLTPIGVGGYGQIGLAIPKVLYNSATPSGVIPVYTHDVDISYSGFTAQITWDTSRLQVTGLQDGEFGVVGTDITYSIDNGVLLVRGMKTAPTEFTKQTILFFMTVTVIGTVTASTPIAINMISGDGYDPNYTTLLKYVQNATDGVYYPYYITPTKNISGAIISNAADLPVNSTQVGDDKTIAATASASGVYIGTAYTPPGESGVVPIVANSNVSDNFPYSGIHVVVEIVDPGVIFSYLTVAGTGPWTLTTTTSTNTEGNLTLDIIGNRSVAETDSMTVGYIQYSIANRDTGYTIPLNNKLSQLTN